jgi:hypothetical protein
MGAALLAEGTAFPVDPPANPNGADNTVLTQIKQKKRTLFSQL